MRARQASRSAVVTALKLMAVGRDRLCPSGPGGVVLLYHRVGGGSGTVVDLPQPLFSAQIQELAEASRITTLDGFLGLVARPEAPEVQPVVLTFDDGTADFAEVAMPVLVAAGAPSTLYLATDFIENGRAFPHGGTALSWKAIGDAMSTGLLTVGSHTHTHALLDRLPPDEVADELDHSIKLIEDHLGVTPEHFAYPKALAGSPAAEAAVRLRFTSAALAGTRANRYGRTDPYRLQRSPVQLGDGMRWFRHKARGGLALEDDIRRLVNRRRYAGAVT